MSGEDIPFRASLSGSPTSLLSFNDSEEERQRRSQQTGQSRLHEPGGSEPEASGSAQQIYEAYNPRKAINQARRQLAEKREILEAGIFETERHMAEAKQIFKHPDADSLRSASELDNTALDPVQKQIQLLENIGRQLIDINKRTKTNCIIISNMEECVMDKYKLQIQSYERLGRVEQSLVQMVGLLTSEDSAAQMLPKVVKEVKKILKTTNDNTLALRSDVLQVERAIRKGVAPYPELVNNSRTNIASNHRTLALVNQELAVQKQLLGIVSLFRVFSPLYYWNLLVSFADWVSPTLQIVAVATVKYCDPTRIKTHTWKGKVELAFFYFTILAANAILLAAVIFLLLNTGGALKFFLTWWFGIFTPWHLGPVTLADRVLALAQRPSIFGLDDGDEYGANWRKAQKRLDDIINSGR